MTKNKFFIFIIAALLISNIILAVFLFLRKDGRRPRPREIIIERLKFDEKQTTEYDELIQKHRSLIPPQEEKMARLKTSMYSLLKNSPEQRVVDSLANEIGKVQTEIEFIHFNHFREIKELCRPDQLDEFYVLTEELSRLFAPPPMKKHEK